MNRELLSYFLPKGALIMHRRKTTSEVDSACEQAPMPDVLPQLFIYEGSAKSRLLFIGDALESEGASISSSAEERRPFMGPDGELLTKMLGAMGLSREDVYLCQSFKTFNDQKQTDSGANSQSLLQKQILDLGPKVIVALGDWARRALLGEKARLGSWGELSGAKVLPTFHPSHLLAVPQAKREAWEHLQSVAKVLGIEIPKGKK